MKKIITYIKESDKRMTFEEWLKWNHDQYERSKIEYAEFLERSKHVTLPMEFDIYNEGQKNKDFKITKYTFRKTLGDYGPKFGDMILLPLSANDLHYKEKPNKENTKDFTEMPELIQYVKQQTWYSDKRGESYDWREWNQIMDGWLRGLKPYIKRGKIKVKVEEHKEDERCRMILIVDDENFNKDREEKIIEMEDKKNLETWKKEWELEQEAQRKRDEELEEYRRKEAEAKKEYEEWEDSLSDAEKTARAMGYGPHHDYELSHPWDSPGYHTQWGWYTGD